jgi:hypothetical protein
MTHWIREGYCCRCGDCCVGPIDGLPAQADGACPYLRRDASPVTACAIHDTVGTYWAMGCNVWPTHPSQIAHLTRCTFSFREVWDGD